MVPFESHMVTFEPLMVPFESFMVPLISNGSMYLNIPLIIHLVIVCGTV